MGGLCNQGTLQLVLGLMRVVRRGDFFIDHSVEYIMLVMLNFSGVMEFFLDQHVFFNCCYFDSFFQAFF